MSPTPKRYRFDNQVPTFEPRPLPARRPDEGQQIAPTPAPDQAFSWHQEKVPVQPQQIIHVHQAPPDRSLQRLALGAGMGAGAVAAGVYYGPLLTASLSFMAICIVVTGLVVMVVAWAIVMVARSVRPEPRPRRGRR